MPPVRVVITPLPQGSFRFTAWYKRWWPVQKSHRLRSASALSLSGRFAATTGPLEELGQRQWFHPEPDDGSEVGLIPWPDEHPEPKVDGCCGDGKIVGRNEVALPA